MTTTHDSAIPKCPDCKRRMHKSARDTTKVYCSWCRKYEPAPKTE